MYLTLAQLHDNAQCAILFAPVASAIANKGPTIKAKARMMRV